MARLGTKLWHLVLLALIIVGALYLFHMTASHKGQSILPGLGINGR